MVNFIIPVVFCSIIIFTGCQSDSVINPSTDKDSYTLQASPTNISSYKNGGGLFILSMKPSQDFHGQVLLSVVADPAIHAQISTEVLTREKWVAEIVIRPDTTATLGIYNITVATTYMDVSDTLNLKAEIVDYDPSWGRSYAISKRDEFVMWLQANHSEFGIEMGQDWYTYFKYPGFDGAGTWIFLNSDWEMTVRWIVVPQSPIWLLLRKRGEAEPTFAAKKELDVPIHEIPVSEFGK